MLTAVVVGLCLFSLVLFMYGARRMERRASSMEETWTQWMHPPDDDDGCSVLEEDDPDGQNTR